MNNFNFPLDFIGDLGVQSDLSQFPGSLNFNRGGKVNGSFNTSGNQLLSEGGDKTKVDFHLDVDNRDNLSLEHAGKDSIFILDHFKSSLERRGHGQRPFNVEGDTGISRTITFNIQRLVDHDEVIVSLFLSILLNKNFSDLLDNLSQFDFIHEQFTFIIKKAKLVEDDRLVFGRKPFLDVQLL